MNPAKTSALIYEHYKNYIKTSFRFNDEEIRQQLAIKLDETDLFSKGPIIEITPAYEKGESIHTLIQAGLLTDEFFRLKSKKLPLDRKLYKHQSKAIEKVVGSDRNIIVSTGTGSGKTESFLIPILNELLTENKEKGLTPGIRALLLYPMNALANDQMKRLRGLLSEYQDITFGVYTGDTENDYKKALEKHLSLHGTEPLANELICREHMLENPPHIFITNYAMLEYLMLRPKESVFFNGIYSNQWKFIVLDEAHTYTGAKGIETSMLLRRLKSTIGLKKGEVKCILTSASLGKGEEDFNQVASFARNLLDEEFDEEDIIVSTKEQLKNKSYKCELNHEDFLTLKEMTESTEEIYSFLEKNHSFYDVFQCLKADYKDDKRQWVYNALLMEKHINETLKVLSKGPMPLDQLSREIFGEKQSLDEMIALIDLCNEIRPFDEHNPIIPARYHYFVRALEGAFLAFNGREKILFLERMKTYETDKDTLKAFEIGLCTHCYQLYIIGEIQYDTECKKNKLVESKKRFLEEDHALSFFAVIDKSYNTWDDNDDFDHEDKLKKNQNIFLEYTLCPKCGIIEQGLGQGDCLCGCPNDLIQNVLLVKSNEKIVNTCGVCGAFNPKNSVERRVILGEDAASSVLSTALYQCMRDKNKEKNSEATCFSPTEDIHSDDFQENNLESFDFSFDDVMEEEVTEKPWIFNSSKQLLVFSDSRQNAAFFASFLSQSYNKLWTKSLLYKISEKNKTEMISNQWTMGDLSEAIAIAFADKKSEPLSIQQRKKKARIILYNEMMDQSALSLESLGLLKFTPNFELVLKNKTSYFFNHQIFKKIGFSEEEALNWMSFLLNDFRYYGAIHYDDFIDPNDEAIETYHRNSAFVFELYSSEVKSNYQLKTFYPKNIKRSNTRLDYFKRIIHKKNIMLNDKQIKELFKTFYDLFISKSPLKELFKVDSGHKMYDVSKIILEFFKVEPVDLTQAKYYQCDSCKKVTDWSIDSVCPKYKCEGKLIPTAFSDHISENHYRNMFLKMTGENLIASEHTAQLETKYAAEIQNKFIKGEVNVLSCSTTFELGVDVGALETVFMKNMPPTPANYVQRAGRAGRDTKSTAFAMTFCRLSSHDFTNFKDPNKMISGVIAPPQFNIANEKIVLRHIYACAFSLFWKEYTQYYDTVKQFFFDNPTDGHDEFEKFLREKPEALKSILKSSFPEEMQVYYDVENWGWTKYIVGENGLLKNVLQEVKSDVEFLEAAEVSFLSQKKYDDAKRVLRMKDTILQRKIISFLSQKNLLPKYGFPVDVVSLQLNSFAEDSRKIDLSRDLSMAISEYAPDGQVIANGKLWTSRYIKKTPHKEWVKYRYQACKCGYFKKHFDEVECQLLSCPICNASLKKGSLIFPEFGFIAEKESKKPSSKRPERTYSGRKFFNGEGETVEKLEFKCGESKVLMLSKKRGKLNVVNFGQANGFFVCDTCGYASKKAIKSGHSSPNGKKCLSKIGKHALGYDFETDITEMDIDFKQKIDESKTGFWESLMYAFLEGFSELLQIDRNDIDGTIYFNEKGKKRIVLFDTVPGGAGHVKRILNEDIFKKVLIRSQFMLNSCGCGGEKMDSSCYSCLRNYQNQYCHEDLSRKTALEGLNYLILE